MVMSSCPNTFNPVKRGLVKEPAEWEWSSFRHYAIGKSSLPGDPQECFPAQVSAKVRREPGAPGGAGGSALLAILRRQLGKSDGSSARLLWGWHVHSRSV